jgi:23S rRNA pseudouridine1911/1915/1917 synthase
MGDLPASMTADTAPTDAFDDADALLASLEPVEQRAGRVETSAHGMRLDKWLVGLAGEFSRSHLQTLIDAGWVRIDQVVVTAPAQRVRAGQCIEVGLRGTAESNAFRPEPLIAARLNVVFEDAHLLVIDKPAGLVVHPAPGNWSGTLLNGLLAHHAGAALLPRAGIVHRLDKDTSGLMVVAKTLISMTALSRAIAAREVERKYLALVHGVPRQPAWSVDLPIGRDPVARVKMAVQPGGKPARTDFVVLASSPGVSALRCHLHTGRTHQIRVHLSHHGLPLVSDALYGGRPALGMVRQALHATSLSFDHPATGERVSFEAELPADLAQAWQGLATG